MNGQGRHLRLWLATGLVVLLLTGCSAGIPFLGVAVKAVDEVGSPVAGATVYSSAGEQQTTGADGQARLSFTSIGQYTINVEAMNRMPMTLQANFPLDAGKTLTARLAKIVVAPPPVPAEALKSASAGMQSSFLAMGQLGDMLSAQLYPLIFQSLFAANGYSLDLIPYEPGMWTEWQVNGDPPDGAAMVMRKALLKRLDNGQEWWQVRLKGEGQGATLLCEVLFSADKQSIRRMRQLGKDGKPAEIPVSEGWYAAPQRLTAESLAGALVKRDDAVKVPAGSYKADRYELATFGGSAKMLLWKAKGVPGGVVKSQLLDESGSEAWRSELAASGAGAKSELGSF